MNKKVVLLAFKGELMCFSHVDAFGHPGLSAYREAGYQIITF